MLYDQSQLTMAYLTAYQITDKPVFAQVAKHILKYVTAKITSPDGTAFRSPPPKPLLRALTRG